MNSDFQSILNELLEKTEIKNVKEKSIGDFSELSASKPELFNNFEEILTLNKVDCSIVKLPPMFKNNNTINRYYQSQSKPSIPSQIKCNA